MQRNDFYKNKNTTWGDVIKQVISNLLISEVDPALLYSYQKSLDSDSVDSAKLANIYKELRDKIKSEVLLRQLNSIIPYSYYSEVKTIWTVEEAIVRSTKDEFPTSKNLQALEEFLTPERKSKAQNQKQKLQDAYVKQVKINTNLEQVLQRASEGKYKNENARGKALIYLENTTVQYLKDNPEVTLDYIRAYASEFILEYLKIHSNLEYNKIAINKINNALTVKEIFQALKDYLSNDYFIKHSPTGFSEYDSQIFMKSQILGFFKSLDKYSNKIGEEYNIKDIENEYLLFLNIYKKQCAAEREANLRLREEQQKDKEIKEIAAFDKWVNVVETFFKYLVPADMIEFFNNYPSDVFKQFSAIKNRKSYSELKDLIFTFRGKSKGGLLSIKASEMLTRMENMSDPSGMEQLFNYLQLRYKINDNLKKIENSVDYYKEQLDAINSVSSLKVKYPHLFGKVEQQITQLNIKSKDIGFVLDVPIYTLDDSKLIEKLAYVEQISKKLTDFRDTKDWKLIHFLNGFSSNFEKLQFYFKNIGAADRIPEITFELMKPVLTEWIKSNKIDKEKSGYSFNRSIMTANSVKDLYIAMYDFLAKSDVHINAKKELIEFIKKLPDGETGIPRDLFISLTGDELLRNILQRLRIKYHDALRFVSLGKAQTITLTLGDEEILLNKWKIFAFTILDTMNQSHFSQGMFTKSMDIKSLHASIQNAKDYSELFTNIEKIKDKSSATFKNTWENVLELMSKNPIENEAFKSDDDESKQQNLIGLKSRLIQAFSLLKAEFDSWESVLWTFDNNALTADKEDLAHVAFAKASIDSFKQMIKEANSASADDAYNIFRQLEKEMKSFVNRREYTYLQGRKLQYDSKQKVTQSPKVTAKEEVPTATKKPESSSKPVVREVKENKADILFKELKEEFLKLVNEYKSWNDILWFKKSPFDRSSEHVYRNEYEAADIHMQNKFDEFSQRINQSKNDVVKLQRLKTEWDKFNATDDKLLSLRKGKAEHDATEKAKQERELAEATRIRGQAEANLSLIMSVKEQGYLNEDQVEDIYKLEIFIRKVMENDLLMSPDEVETQLRDMNRKLYFLDASSKKNKALFEGYIDIGIKKIDQLEKQTLSDGLKLTLVKTKGLLEYHRSLGKNDTHIENIERILNVLTDIETKNKQEMEAQPVINQLTGLTVPGHELEESLRLLETLKVPSEKINITQTPFNLFSEAKEENELPAKKDIKIPQMLK